MSAPSVETQRRRAVSGSAASRLTSDNQQPAAPPRTASDDGAADDADDADDALANILSLKLKKPKHWKWELTTSRSSSNISLPRVLLYNHKGDLLVDANTQEEQVFTQPPVDERQERGRPKKSPPQKRGVSRCATVNLENVAGSAVDSEFSDLRIAEATPSPEPSTWPKTPVRPAPATIADLQSPPLWPLGRRATSCKEVRFKVDNDRRRKPADAYRARDLPTPPSTATTTTTTTSSSLGSRQKRRHRRSQSSLGRSLATSESILERLSLNRGRLSSPECSEQEQRRPRYFLCTSKAGTLVVMKDSFSRYQRRRKLPRNSSAENVRNAGSPSSKSDSTNSLQSHAMNGGERRPPLMPPEHRGKGSSLENVAELQARTRRKVRRSRGDAWRGRSSSDTEAEAARCRNGTTGHHDGDAKKLLRKFGDFRSRSKKGVVSIAPEAAVLVAAERPTAR